MSVPATCIRSVQGFCAPFLFQPLQGKLGSCSASPIAVICRIHLQCGTLLCCMLSMILCSILFQRLQEAEGRNQELTQSVTSATRPLLRQIENLQSTYSAQSSSWERAERNLMERLGEHTFTIHVLYSLE